MKRHNFRWLLAAVFAVILIGVAALLGLPKWRQQRAEAAMDERLKATIVNYNHALSRGFETLDMQKLNTVATRNQAYTEYYQMAALGEERVKLLSDMKNIEFGDVRRESEGTSTVDTVETWDYRQVSLDTSKTVRDERGTKYRLTYRLVKIRDGRWLVDEIKTTGQAWRVWPASKDATEGAK